MLPSPRARCHDTTGPAERQVSETERPPVPAGPHLSVHCQEHVQTVGLRRRCLMIVIIDGLLWFSRPDVELKPSGIKTPTCFISSDWDIPLYCVFSYLTPWIVFVSFITCLEFWLGAEVDFSCWQLCDYNWILLFSLSFMNSFVFCFLLQNKLF